MQNLALIAFLFFVVVLPVLFFASIILNLAIRAWKGGDSSMSRGLGVSKVLFGLAFVLLFMGFGLQFGDWGVGATLVAWSVGAVAVIAGLFTRRHSPRIGPFPRRRWSRR